jgi:hypothetical protein
MLLALSLTHSVGDLRQFHVFSKWQIRAERRRRSQRERERERERARERERESEREPKNLCSFDLQTDSQSAAADKIKRSTHPAGPLSHPAKYRKRQDGRLDFSQFVLH